MTQQRAVHFVGDTPFSDEPTMETGRVPIREHGQPQFQGHEAGRAGRRSLPRAVHQGMGDLSGDGDVPTRQRGFRDGLPWGRGKILEIAEVSLDQVDGLIRVECPTDYQFCM